MGPFFVLLAVKMLRYSLNSGLNTNMENMKKFYTALAIMCMALSLNAQWKQGPTIDKAKYSQVADEMREEPFTPSFENYNRGDFLWSDDFSDPGMWTATNLGDYGWILPADTLGWFFANPINSLSDGDFAFVWNGDPNTGDDPIESIYTLTLNDPIDISGTEAALLEFNLYGARFFDDLDVQVSTDGENWTTVGTIDDIGNLTSTGGSVTANSLVRSHNITAIVAGQDELYVQFVYQGGIAYGWMIDDVRLVVPLDHNVRLENFWTGDIDFDYEYTMTPVEQVRSMILGASALNLGANVENISLEAEVFLEGEVDPVFTGTSPAQEITQGDVDTIWWDTGYLPEVVGEYTVNFNLISESEDQSAGDDSGSKNFMTTDFIWGNDDYTNFSDIWDGALGDVQVDDEWYIGTAFSVINPGSFFTGCEFRLASGTDLSQEIGIALYVFGDEIELVDGNTTYYQLVSGDATGFTRVEAEDPIELIQGSTYLLTLQHYGGEGTLRIRGGEYVDEDISTFIYGEYGTGGTAGWFFYDDFNPTIRMGLDGFVSTEDIDTESMLQLLQNFPNPFDRTTIIPFTLDQPQPVTLQVFDMAGKEVMKVDEGTMSRGSQRIEIDGAALAPGIYFYTLTAGQERMTRKMTVN